MLGDKNVENPLLEKWSFIIKYIIFAFINNFIKYQLSIFSYINFTIN